MAGHSHWAKIKRAKAVTDARRGKHWSKLSRAIIVAARIGGPDPTMNFALRYAIEAARDENMPRDTIERAIKRGSGEGEADSFIDMNYEGYAPGGAAIFCTALTDNRTRTAGEIRNLFEHRGGTLGASGCVAWMFAKRGVLSFAKAAASEDRITEIAIDAGADDVQAGEQGYEVSCPPEAFVAVRTAFEQAGLKPESAEITMVASNNITLSGENAEKALKLIEALEDHDDIQKVYSNLDISDEEAERLSG